MTPLLAFFHMSSKNFAHWVTALWLFGIGVILGGLAVFVVWAILKAVAPKYADRCTDALRGSILFPITMVMLIWAAIGILGTFAVQEPMSILNSLRRLPAAGTTEHKLDIPALVKLNDDGSVPAVDLGISVDSDELSKLDISATGRFDLVARIVGEPEDVATYTIREGSAWQWTRGDKAFLSRKLPPGQMVEFYARNDTDKPVEGIMNVTIEPEHVEAVSIFQTGLIVAMIYFIYFGYSMFFPKTAAISEATATSEISQLLFLLCAVIGCLFMIVAIYLPYQTFGEDIKVLKHTGLQVMLILGMVVAIWASSTSISDEIEGKTALTLLSKPVSRRQFIIGKFLGIVGVVAVLFVMISLFFLPAVASKPMFDSREGATFEYERFGEKGISWQLLHEETVDVVPGVVLVFLETVVLASVSVAISTRLPMIANFLITFGVYAMGHLTPAIMQVSAQGFEPVKFVASLLATVLPVLENFEIYGAISAGREVPLEYIGLSALFAILYSLMAMFLALILFEDRDLA